MDEGGRDPRMLLRLAAATARRMSPKTIDPDDLEDLAAEMVAMAMLRGWGAGRFMSMEWLYHDARRKLYPDRRTDWPPPPGPGEEPDPDVVLAAFRAVDALPSEARRIVVRVVIEGRTLHEAASELCIGRHRASRVLRSALADLRQRMRSR